ncbi:MAG: hypothetical protein C0469_10050, partial [Cyanobacteria bacterium DS2.3.42]|nr:hypothetical protein [Cyanobacteria bacterium DS2.3.42]
SDDFIKCPFCQHDLKSTCTRCGTLQQANWTSCPKCGLSEEDAQRETVCTGCSAEIQGEWTRCPYCQEPRKHKEKNL